MSTKIIVAMGISLSIAVSKVKERNCPGEKQRNDRTELYNLHSGSKNVY